LIGGNAMSKEDEEYLRKMAKDMIIAGESFDKIMEKTHLRLKDLRRIQIEEIDPHF
jgi:hypothetical protein